MKKKLNAPWLKFYDSDERPHLEYPNFSAYKLIEYTASKHFNNYSYNYYGTRVTYHEFLKQIDEAARSLKALGVREKDVVSICMPNTPEGIISFYAVNKIGAIASMIHPLSAENEIKEYLNVSKSSWLITIDFTIDKVNHILKETSVKKVVAVSVAESMPTLLKSLYNTTNLPKAIKSLNPMYYLNGNTIELNLNRLNWREFISLGKSYNDEIDDDVVKGGDVAVILYSGGTTGTPKGVKLTNLNLNASAMQNFERNTFLRDKDKCLAIMPIFHGFGLSVCIHCIQYFGGESILLPQFDARTFDKVMKKYEPNFVIGVPTLFEAMTNNKNFDRMNLSYLKAVISGGDSLSYELKQKFDKWLLDHKATCGLREGYGLTECCAASCLSPLNHYKPGSIGIPYPDTFYKIVDIGTEKEVPYGVEGEIVITGPTVMDGYINNKKETKQTLRKHRDGHVWLHTGDSGYMDEDGYVFFKGRIKRMIITSGYCVYPSNIENVIDGCKYVSSSCVIGLPHPYKINAPKAFIVLKDEGIDKEIALANIKEEVEKNLARYSWPVEYEFRSELPKTKVGKIAYNVLMQEELSKNNGKKWDKDDSVVLDQVDNIKDMEEEIEKSKKSNKSS